MTIDFKTWCGAMLRGEIQRHEDTPGRMLDVLRDWFDGKKSAMRRFLDGEPVRPRDLIREIDQCRAENLLGEAEAERLRLMHVWAIREGALAEAMMELRAGNEQFLHASQAAGLDPWLAHRLFHAVTGHDLPREAAAPASETGPSAPVEPVAWLIRNTGSEDPEEMFWSNALGWTGITGASLFSDAEHGELDLPMGGEWVGIGLAAQEAGGR